MRPKTFNQAEALHAAMLQFWESGYAASSMQDLVDRMGISRQSLYDTYGNKRKLFEAALARYRAEIIEPKVAEIRDPARTPREAIYDYLESIARGATDTPVGCLLVRTATEIPVDDEEIGPLIADCVRLVRDALCERIAEGQDQGEFARTHSAADLASGVVVLGMGLHVMRRLPDRGEGIRPPIDSLLAGLAGGTGPKPGRD